MNATELFLADGRNAGIYFCAECRNVRRTVEEASGCCLPYKCTYCGTDVDRKTYRTACPSCIEANQKAKEAARFEAAEKVTQWDGWLYSEAYGSNDGYFQEVEDFREWIESESDEGTEMPGYVWTCDPIRFAVISIGEITERIADGREAYEDFDVDDLHGLDALETAIEAFNAANESVVSYRPNYKRALLVNKSNARAMASGAPESPLK